MRLLTFVEYAAILIGAIGMLVGTHFAALKDSHLGVYLIGAGLALAGAEALYSREMSLLYTGETAPRHSGFPAIVWGFMLLCIGGALIGYAYLTGAGLWPQVAATLARYPGATCVAIGLLMVGFSILLLVDSGSRRGWLLTLLLRLPRVLVAIVMLLGGITAAAGGTWQLLDAPGFAAFQSWAKSRIDKALEGHPAQTWFRKHVEHRALQRKDRVALLLPRPSGSNARATPGEFRGALNFNADACGRQASASARTH